MSKIIVIGHKNPDTDSIVSSIVAADYFRNVLKLDAKAYRAGEINNETNFILQKFGIEPPELISASEGYEGIVLVDHNEISQTFDGIDFSKFNFIFDHHNISLKTDKPIFFRAEPIGSTASILAKIFFEKGESISEVNAKLMLAGILSDTLNFTSPTTTPEDKEIAEKINKIASIDIKSFVDEMFSAKSSLDGISIEEITSSDYKVFEMGGKKVGIGVWETTNPETVNEKKSEILAALKEKKQKNDLDYVFFMPVDIIKQASYMYIIGEDEEELAEKVFGGKTEDSLLLIKGAVSRKKQIVPPLTEELNK